MAATKRHLVVALLALAGALFILNLALPGNARGQSGEDELVQPQVVGSSSVPNGKYPFLTALLDTRGGSTAYEQQFCGGTLVNSNHVLTAAHCVSQKNVFGQLQVSPVQPLRITAGRTVLNSTQGQVRKVSNISIHPRYNGNNDAYDVAVIKLSSPVTGVKPIKLASPSMDSLETPGRAGTVAGWGTTSEGGQRSDRMREARPPIVSDTSCKNSYGNQVYPSIMVCAGKTGVDTCQGDSGGPLFVYYSGEYRQIGITSFGIGCARSGYPGVYTEINEAPILLDFIAPALRR